jgi:hypothetical protein
MMFMAFHSTPRRLRRLAILSGSALIIGAALLVLAG